MFAPGPPSARHRARGTSPTSRGRLGVLRTAALLGKGVPASRALLVVAFLAISLIAFLVLRLGGSARSSSPLPGTVLPKPRGHRYERHAEGIRGLEDMLDFLPSAAELGQALSDAKGHVPRPEPPGLVPAGPPSAPEALRTFLAGSPDYALVHLPYSLAEVPLVAFAWEDKFLWTDTRRGRGLAVSDEFLVRSALWHRCVRGRGSPPRAGWRSRGRQEPQRWTQKPPPPPPPTPPQGRPRGATGPRRGWSLAAARGQGRGVLALLRRPPRRDGRPAYGRHRHGRGRPPLGDSPAVRPDARRHRREKAGPDGIPRPPPPPARRPPPPPAALPRRSPPRPTCTPTPIRSFGSSTTAWAPGLPSASPTLARRPRPPRPRPPRPRPPRPRATVLPAPRRPPPARRRRRRLRGGPGRHVRRRGGAGL